MNKSDFEKLIGAHSADAEYLPVACLLRSGYGCAGYYNEKLNRDLDNAFVLVNSRLVGFHDHRPGKQGTIEDFTGFLEDVVRRSFEQADSDASADNYGRSVPLAAIPFPEVAIVYPVAHIGKMMRALETETRRIPAFLDFENRSVIVKLLNAKLW